VQEPSGSLHIFRGLRPVQREELERQTVRVLRLDAGLAAGSEELLDSSMPEAPDHV